MADCLVVGANGFVGSHLVDELSAQGHDVTAFDRFSIGRPRFEASGVRLLAGDFMNKADVATAVAGHRFVFHFLSTTDPATAEGDPTLDVRTNIAASIDLLQSCVQAGVEKVFFASTGGAIYGNQPQTLFDEDDRTLPVSPYAIGKQAIESYLRYFHVVHGLDYLVARISNPYGTRQRPGKRQGVIPIFLRRVKADEELTVFGDGSMIRDYVYVGDLVKMVVATVSAETRHKVYNLGSGRGHTVNDVLDAVRHVTGLEPRVSHCPTPSTFVDHVTLDTSRFRAEFGDFAKTDLVEGIGYLWREMLEQEK